MTTIAKHYIPTSEANFNTWVRHFEKQINEHPEEYRLSDERVAELHEWTEKWTEHYDQAVAARDASKAASRTKDETREKLTSVVRSVSRLIQANDRVSDAAREDAGLPVHKSSRTPVRVPTSSPVGYVMATEQLEHTLMYSDSSTPTRRARPSGVTCCEIFIHIGKDTPQDPDAYRLHSISTRSPDRISFKAEDAGKMASYLVRWVNTKGEVGPWSRPISAIVPAV